MVESSVPLRLRSVTVRVPYRLEFCSQECLLRAHGEFMAALPGGMGCAQIPELTSANLLFETPRGTLIKHRRHVASADTLFFDVPFQFDLESQKRGFELLRNLRPAFVSLPGGECLCSYEADYHPGRLVCPRASLHGPHLAQKYAVRFLSSREESRMFLGAAWSMLSDLNRMGIQHGDPSFYNFVETKDGLILIDLDDLMQQSAERASDWDFKIFLFQTFIPVAASFMAPAEMSELARDLFGERGIALPDAVFASLARGIEAVASLRAFEVELQASQIFQQELLSKADFDGVRDQLAAAQEQSDLKDAEIALLAASAKERLEALDGAHRELAEAYQANSALTAQLHEKEKEIQDLARAAGERLQALETVSLRLQTLEQHGKQSTRFWNKRSVP